MHWADLAPVALFVTAAVGAVSGMVGLVRSGKTEKIKSKIDETDTAFGILKATVEIQQKEIEQLRAAHLECDQRNRELMELVKQSNEAQSKQELTIRHLKERMDRSGK